jgi:2-polyprenyl-3-methyl-5-hydroxy-6-metoxy-1,4-benzoquinol methylase
MKAARACDIGCGNGAIAIGIAPYVKHILAIDPEPWPDWSGYSAELDNVSFLSGSVEALQLPSETIDLVICNQVYEHTPDPRLLISTMHRLLKPGGIAYFAGPNLLWPIEPHTLWPFVHWMPRTIAVELMRTLGSTAILDARSVSYWQLRRWLDGFQASSQLQAIMSYHARRVLPPLAAKAIDLCPKLLWKALSPIAPGFVFLLRKL